MTRVPENSIHPKSVAEWRSWLEENRTRTEGGGFINYKKAAGKPRLDYPEAVEEALCFGWVDSKPRKLDEARSMLWFAPRKAGSGWSRLNTARVEALIASGRMAPAGMEKVEAARRDGSWNALDSIEALEVPPDLAEALDRYPSAREHFDAFPPSVKKNILAWIASVKRAETRAKRIEETARLADDNIRAKQWRE